MKELPTNVQIGMKRRVINVTGDDGSNWELREMTAAQRDEYMNLLNKRFEGTRIKDFRGMHSDLLTRSLFRNGGENGGKPVTVEELAAWPASTTQDLADLASELSGLKKDKPGEEEKDDAKKG